MKIELLLITAIVLFTSCNLNRNAGWIPKSEISANIQQYLEAEAGRPSYQAAWAEVDSTVQLWTIVGRPNPLGIAEGDSVVLNSVLLFNKERSKLVGMVYTMEPLEAKCDIAQYVLGSKCEHGWMLYEDKYRINYFFRKGTNGLPNDISVMKADSRYRILGDGHFDFARRHWDPNIIGADFTWDSTACKRSSDTDLP